MSVFSGVFIFPTSFFLKIKLKKLYHNCQILLQVPVDSQLYIERKKGWVFKILKNNSFVCLAGFQQMMLLFLDALINFRNNSIGPHTDFLLPGLSRIVHTLHKRCIYLVLTSPSLAFCCLKLYQHEQPQTDYTVEYVQLRLVRRKNM